MSKHGQEELKEGKDGCSEGKKGAAASGSQSKRLRPGKHIRSLVYPKINERVKTTGM